MPDNSVHAGHVKERTVAFQVQLATARRGHVLGQIVPLVLLVVEPRYRNLQVLPTPAVLVLEKFGVLELEAHNPAMRFASELLLLLHV